MKTTRAPAPYWNPYMGGVALGLVLFLSILITGNGLGASGAIGHSLAFVTKLMAPEYVNNTPYFAKMAGGPANPLKHRMIWLGLGVILGGFVSGLLAGRLRREIIRGPQVSVRWRLVLAFAGGSLMGWGAALGRGCTSGQALSGGAVLSAGSWAFMMMAFAGGYSIAYPFRKLWL